MLADAPPLLGSTEPRLFTPPLRELTPETSYGFAVIDFARDVLGQPLDPWQEWLVIHAGELLPDGRPRFRTVLVLVARQAGKTHLCTVLALFWMFVEKWPLTLGMSTMLEYAKEAWDGAVALAEETPELAKDLPKNAVLRGNNDVHMKTVHRTRYKIAAANRRGGRSLRIDRLIIDELREHSTWAAWNAATNAMNARPLGQAWAITNQGDDTAVVLEALRTAALRHLEEGDGDPRLGLFEWSAPDGCEVDDPDAIAAANPNVGRRQHWDDLLGPAVRAKAAGGEEEAGFRTEVLCQRVRLLNPAIDPKKWELCPALVDGLDAVRSRVAMVLDVAPDQQHATLYAAATIADGRVGIDFVKAWSGSGCTNLVRRELPALLARLKPRVFGWLPDGPAASLAAVLADRSKQGRTAWPPPGVKVEAIRGEMAAVCMGFAELVKAGQVARGDDPLLNDQVGGAEKLKRGDRWVFARSGAGHVDALYAAAGAAHLAQTLPPPKSMTLPSPLPSTG
ncbi:terminase [Micromonospora chalcea]|uniref:terminase n=1 Tax=Micromonospora chalcea TaxID=1874 RepID=UPI0021A39D4A|nr:terminase [Micromonospora chalcea]MCT2277999.1 terminase [Micromonospora chalcea]